MRLRIGVSCAILACVAAGLASAAGCSSSSSDAPPTRDDASVQSDAATTPDTGTDVEGDAGGPVDAGCSPRTGFQPAAYVPAIVSTACHQLATPAALAADCFADGSTYAECTGFAGSVSDAGAAGAACLSCLLSPEDSDGGYGPVIQGVVPRLNVAGCIEVVDRTEAGQSCASLVQSAAACTEFACRSSCPVSDDSSRAAYLACTQLAASGVCNVYASAASACVAAGLEAGASTGMGQCIDGTGDAGQALTILNDLCGP